MTEPRRRPDVRVRRRGDAVELVDGHGAVLGVANDVAAAVLELCDGETSVEEMADAVSAVFAVDADTAARDIADALDALAAVGALELHRSL